MAEFKVALKNPTDPKELSLEELIDVVRSADGLHGSLLVHRSDNYAANQVVSQFRWELFEYLMTLNRELYTRLGIEEIEEPEDEDEA